MQQEKIQLADDDHESLRLLVRLRGPALLLGLFLGISISFVTSSFEEVLTKNVHVAFFLPFIVYMAAAIGTQTDAIYTRDLDTGHTNFHMYLKKELALGGIFGVLFGAVAGLIAMLWLRDSQLALSVGIASTLAIATAPIIALLVAQSFQSFRKDPATGTGPVATVIQDVISIMIFGFVASFFLL